MLIHRTVSEPLERFHLGMGELVPGGVIMQWPFGVYAVPSSGENLPIGIGHNSSNRDAIIAVSFPGQFTTHLPGSG
jgi:hypothetical protein